jgi:hypothetical protein
MSKTSNFTPIKSPRPASHLRQPSVLSQQVLLLQVNRLRNKLAYMYSKWISWISSTKEAANSQTCSESARCPEQISSELAEAVNLHRFLLNITGMQVKLVISPHLTVFNNSSFDRSIMNSYFQAHAEMKKDGTLFGFKVHIFSLRTESLKLASAVARWNEIGGMYGDESASWPLIILVMVTNINCCI